MPSLWVVGQKLRSATLNILVNAITELQSRLATNEATDITQNTNIGTLQTDVTALKAGTPYLHVTNTNAVTNGAIYQYNAVVYDTNSGWNSSTKKYTVPTTGYYYAIAGVQPSTAIGCAPGVRVNGTLIIAAGYVTDVASSSGNVSGVLRLTASDTVWITEGGNSYTPAQAVTNFLMLKYLGPL